MQELQNWFWITYLSVELSLVRSLAQFAWLSVLCQPSWAKVWTKDRSTDKKSENSFKLCMAYVFIPDSLALFNRE